MVFINFRAIAEREAGSRKRADPQTTLANAAAPRNRTTWRLAAIGVYIAYRLLALDRGGHTRPLTNLYNVLSVRLVYVL